MDYQPVRRAPDAFQQPVTEKQISAMCRRAFGPDTTVISAVELDGGFYNNTYRVDYGAQRPVILRVAPEPALHSRADPELMRNEHAGAPFLAPITALLPRTLVADFTHDIIGRDYLFQTLLDGVPAPEGLRSYPRPAWASLFRQLGGIARSIHSVRGDRFGRVAGPTHLTWSDALCTWFEDIAADLADAGLEADDIGTVVELADRHRTVLDAVKEPRLLHGDLWVGNLMIEPGARTPTITGTFDCDRVWWGDPEADWPIYLTQRRPGTERDAFWDSYGQVGTTPEAVWRGLVYQVRHAAALRLEYNRSNMEKEIAENYSEVSELIGNIRELDS